MSDLSPDDRVLAGVAFGESVLVPDLVRTLGSARILATPTTHVDDVEPLRDELPQPSWTWWPPARVYGRRADDDVVGVFCSRVAQCACGSVHLCGRGVGHTGACVH